MEAAGCEVLSGSDITAKDNVLRQPPPHHPQGSTAVELTIRHPGDPRHLAHAAMFRFWLHRAHRLGIPAVFMCHQHMHLFRGWACVRLTEHILRCALSDFNGDLHVNTVFGIGKYWRETLSPETRRVRVSCQAGQVRVQNGSDLDLKDVPIDITTHSGQRYTVLVDLEAGKELTFPVTGVEHDSSLAGRRS